MRSLGAATCPPCNTAPLTVAFAAKMLDTPQAISQKGRNYEIETGDRSRGISV